MKQKVLHKLKQNSAFTLMEMMVVTMVTIILLGISIIAIKDWSDKMKMTELDSCAKSVYLEAQYQLASLETEGSLTKLYNDLAVDGGLYYADYHDRRLEQAPADYKVEEYGSFYQGLYYFTNKDGIITTFIPTLSLSDENGQYLVELNPETGDVYGVFYWEKSNEYLSDQESFVLYEKIKGMETKGTGNNRSLESRSEYMIGYYGGIVGDSVSSADYELNQKVEIVNGEELYIKLSYDYNGRVIEHIAGDTEPFDIEITILGETSGERWIPEFDIKENYTVNSQEGRIETGFLLDGMGAGQDFASITSAAGKAFIPGEDLKISVKTLYQYDGVKLKEQSSTYHANSLFHDVTDRIVATGGSETIERVIGVSAVRHLRNLDANYYNGTIVKAVGEKEVNSYEIILKNDIDFEKGAYIYSPSRPIASLAPIRNEDIFTVGTKHVAVNGNDFVIKKLMVTSSTDNAGLFAETKNVDFINVKLEDFTLDATGCTNVGALVGYAEGGTIDHSGVYLSPSYRDEFGVKKYFNQNADSTFGNQMVAHYETMMITGKANVGGLVGIADQTIITDAYSAVKVNGENTVGGLVGYAIGKIADDANVQEIDTEAEVSAVVSIQNSYASGKVFASDKEAGGLIGYALNLCITNSYATGDVWSNTEMAGFVGDSYHGYYEKSFAYGEVLSIDGKDTYIDGVIVGGFFATGENNHGDMASLGYLSQVGYNSKDTILGDSGLLKMEYKDLTEMATNRAASSFPYDGNLLFKSFPFQMVTEHHYGDWPIQYYINTSLVYYEKYEDGSYGYYSVAKLTDTAEENSDVNKYVWVLNSLRNETCIEDGYALLSMFYLDTLDYSVYQYVDKTQDNEKNPSWQLAQKEADATPIKGTLTVSDNYDPVDNSDKMVRLLQQGALEFKAYEEGTNPYNADYTGQEVKSTFSTNGMYLYQLPYELQNTYRYYVDNFYDVIVFEEGYAVGNEKGEDGEVGGTPVIEDEVYYYCPHFSKLAINPGLGVTESTNPELFAVLTQPDRVAVRSARQLNNLGRVPYYWNDKGGGTDLITYSQEVDINFSTYANTASGKKYCGRTYNLLAFDTDYANQPIGDWNGDSKGYGSFQNDYNGNHNKIIDYCVKSDKQYVGLFGEIYKAGGATKAQISNVVMTVSNPNHEPTYMLDMDKPVAQRTEEALQNNAGLIIGSYTDKSSAAGASRPRAGVGALVGSDYTIGVTDGEAKIFTIYNCASTGYKVQYHLMEPNGGKLPLGIALGGMIGYTRGNLAQSSADNHVKLVARWSMTGDEAAVTIGGFTGSSFYGTTLNCYSGGTIDVDDANHTYYVNRLRIAGFCPGWLEAPGITNTQNYELVRYQNVYSYTQVSSNVWNVKESASAGKFNHYFPTVSRMRLKYEYRFGEGTKWHTDSQNGSNTGVRVPGFSYYYETKTYAEDVMNHISSEARQYFVNAGGNSPKTCDPATFYQLTQFNWLNSNESTGNNVFFDSTEWYPTLQKANNGYPFPAFVTDASGAYTHYGTWPVEVDPLTGATLLAGENFEIGYDHDGLGNNQNTQPCNLYLLEDGTYYAEFSFTKQTIEEGDPWYANGHLYTECPINGLVDNRGRQLYLTFNSNGICGTTTSDDEQSIVDDIDPDVVYSLYIYGIDTSKPYNQQTITWKLIKK